MSRYTLLTETEHEILSKFWELDGPISAKALLEIFHQCGKTWKFSTLNTFLIRLFNAGYLDAEPGKRCYLYKPAMTRTEYERKNAQYYLDKMHNGSCIKFIEALAGGDPLPPEKEEALNNWLLQCKANK